MAATYMEWFDPTSNVTFTIDFDAVENEAPNYGVSITEYPIEMGANLIDFVRPENVTLRLGTFISNAPARVGLSHLDGVQANSSYAMRVREPVLPGPPHWQLPQSVAGYPLTRETTVIAQVRTWSPLDQKIQRVTRVLDELKRAMYEAREFTVYSELLGDFEHMLLKSIRTDRDAKSGNALRVDLELQQVSYAELVQRDVTHLLPKKPKKPKSKPPTDAGKVSTKEMTPEQKRSILDQAAFASGDPATSAL